MFQDFEVRSRPADGPPRLAELRKELSKDGFAGFIIPRADVHQGENVAARDERLSWLTGFTGSAGFCIALADRAGVFIDGRYRVQVKSQIDLEHFTPVPWPETKPGDWLIDTLPEGGKIGFDPWLHGWQDIETLNKRLDGSGVALQPMQNLIDRIWADQPAPPMGMVDIYPEELAGDSHATKRERIAKDLSDAGQTAAVLTLPDSIAWLLNIRGADIARTPVAHAFAILHQDATVDLFISPQKLTDAVKDHLGADVRLHDVKGFSAELQALTGDVLLDKQTVPVAVATLIKDAGANCVFDSDPCILPKARKSPAEIAATKVAQKRDGAAMVEFLCWLDAEAPKGNLTEIDVVKKLEEFRRATNALRDISFETISATGPHGAICHYRVSDESNLRVEPGQLLLVDSGAQYLDGTTDITRTVPVGEVGEEEKACFTRVLQGMIAMSRARWPVGLAGRDLDAIARYPLWLAGQDYDHGTGHGVGAYLGVHEGPARLSRVSDVALDPGMILSNEPGYYREDAFGIRIENLLVVVEAPALPGADAREMLSFETLTYVPIDRRLIVRDDLSRAERDWLNAYHATTFEMLADTVSDTARTWLKDATAPL
ncbi:aminopeptidase P family protein [Aliiroseovarius sp. YM-037]|uniref:aminopeptidase P family protein n=1 Tax=Aliiroseovarius sp. YM-037 TaxID=3341728 RepID=UPI003A80CF2A